MLCIHLLTPIYLFTWLCFAFTLLPCTQRVCIPSTEHLIGAIHSYQCAEVLSWIRIQRVICPGEH